MRPLPESGRAQPERRLLGGGIANPPSGAVGEDVFASERSRRLLLAASAFVYAAVFALVLLVEQPALGTAHLFYLAILLLAMAGGPWSGAAGGVIAAGLFTAAVVLNSSFSSASLLTYATGIRLVAFVVVGTVVGVFARGNRMAFAQLKALAERDHLTQLLNSRGLDDALTRRVARGKPFGLLYGDIDSLKRINDQHGHAEGDRLIKHVAELLQASVRARDVVARVGGDEFAAVVETRSDAEARELALRLEQTLAEAGLGITLGWAQYPDVATDGTSLVHAADKRLYERKTSKPDRRSRWLAAVE
jgi:diguanylate cyclase (GGDEF)-like protein